jgi:hypothetical protein
MDEINRRSALAFGLATAAATPLFALATPAGAAGDGLNWQAKESLDLLSRAKDGRQIIIGTRYEKEGSQAYRYNVVFYHEPMKVWYGGPGIKVRDEDIEHWAEIPAPGS